MAVAAMFRIPFDHIHKFSNNVKYRHPCLVSAKGAWKGKGFHFKRLSMTLENDISWGFIVFFYFYFCIHHLFAVIFCFSCHLLCLLWFSSEKHQTPHGHIHVYTQMLRGQKPRRKKSPEPRGFCPRTTRKYCNKSIFLLYEPVHLAEPI